jgi:hypothetical protein
MKPNMPLSYLLVEVRRNASLPEERSEATPPQQFSKHTMLKTGETLC